MTKQQLKPCPCCGNEEIHTDMMDFLGEGDFLSHAMCIKCGASSPEDNWNTRASDSHQELINELVKALDNADAWLELDLEYRGSPLQKGIRNTLTKAKGGE